MSEIDFQERLITVSNAFVDVLERIAKLWAESNKLWQTELELKQIELSKPVVMRDIVSSPVMPGQVGGSFKVAKTPTGTKCNRCHEPIKWPHDFQHRQPGDKPLNPDGTPHTCQDRSLMPQ